MLARIVKSMNTDRCGAHWITRPAFKVDEYVHYRRVDGKLLKGGSVPPKCDEGYAYSCSTFLFDAPLKVYFDFTNRCNLNCRHCISSSSPYVDTTNELPTPRLMKLISELADIGVLELAVAGGEPFAHPDWMALFKHITASGMNLLITTNGVLVNPKVIAALKEIDPYEVRVSFDGGPSLHEHVRGAKTYHKALRAISLLVENEISSTARLTLCYGAERELPTLFRDLETAGVRTIKIAAVKAAGRASTEIGNHLLGSFSNLRMVALLFELGRAHNLEVQLSSEDFPLSVTDAKDQKLRDDERQNCGAGFETCYIAPQGDVLGCVTIPDLSFGNLHTESFIKVWRGQRAKTYRRLASSTSECRLCDALSCTSTKQSNVASALL